MARRKLRKAKYKLPVYEAEGVPKGFTLVDNPYFNASHPEARSNPKEVFVQRSKDDPLGGMLSRQQIDWAQFAAGRMWQKFHEQSEIGSVSAIDPTKESVDGGKIYQPFSDRQRAAMAELRLAAKILGPHDNIIVWEILGKRQSLQELANTEWYRRALGVRFRGALDKLAVLWRLSMSPTRACVAPANHLQGV